MNEMIKKRIKIYRSEIYGATEKNVDLLASVSDYQKSRLKSKVKEIMAEQKEAGEYNSIFKNDYIDEHTYCMTIDNFINFSNVLND